MTIVKEVKIVLTEEEIISPDPIEIKIHLMSEDDPNNDEGVTYTITYSK